MKPIIIQCLRPQGERRWYPYLYSMIIYEKWRLVFNMLNYGPVTSHLLLCRPPTPVSRRPMSDHETHQKKQRHFLSMHNHMTEMVLHNEMIGDMCLHLNFLARKCKKLKSAWAIDHKLMEIIVIYRICYVFWWEIDDWWAMMNRRIYNKYPTTSKLERKEWIEFGWKAKRRRGYINV